MRVDGAALLQQRARTGWVAATPWHYGWTVVAVAFLSVGIAQGTRAAYGVLLVALVDTFGWGRGVTAGAIGFGAVAWAVSATPLGLLLDRWGPRHVWAGAAVVTGLGLAVAATTQAPWQLYLGIGVLAGIGSSPLMPSGQGVVIATWFARRRGLATGLMATGIGLGMLVLAPLTQAVVAEAGWRVAFVGLAALFILGVAPLIALLQRHRPEDCGLQAYGAEPPATGVGPPTARAGDGPTVGDAVRQRRFWAMAAGALLAALGFQVLLVHGVAHLCDVGFTPTRAAAVLGLSGAFAVLGNLLWGSMADRWGGEWAYSAGSLALLAGIGALAAASPDREWVLYAYAALFGLACASRLGGMNAFLVAALARGRSLGAVMGLVSTGIAIGSGIGPVLGGVVFDLSGSYTAAFLLAAGSTVAAVACIWVAAPRRGLLSASAASLASPRP